MWRVPLLLLTVLFAQPAAAAIIINEVAWMGSTESANDEWIEFYNTGGDTDVTGWILTDGGALSIPLSGSITANSYAVLERTDDTTAPGTAFLIYTGALANDGRTLTLKRTDGAIEDQVAGGTDWNEIGGDNTTKETAQLTSKGWVTGIPTPGAQNVAMGTPAEDEDEEGGETIEDDTATETENETSTRSSKSAPNTHISLMLPQHELQLAITAPKTTFINQRTPLLVAASGISDKLIPSLSYTWNFGNFVTASGTSVAVQYQKPGEYVIIVEAKYARHTARARHQITVLPTPLSLARDSEGTLMIHNDAPYELDVSGFTLKGQAERRIPKNTFIAPRASLPITDTSFAAVRIVTLLDENNRVVATFDSFASPKDEVNESDVSDDVPLVVIDYSPPPTPKISALATSTTPTVFAVASEVSSTPPTAQLAAVTSAGIPTEKLPYLGLIGLILIGTLAIYTQKREG